MPRSGVAAGVDEFSAFFERERVAAVRLAWLLTHDPAVSEDLVQEAFTAVFVRFGSVDRPAAYLRVAILNGARERARRNERERRRVRLVSSAGAESVEGPTGGITDAVAHLPFAQRAVVVLRYWADLPDDEIAATLGVRPGTVRSLLSRASARLRQEIER